MAAASDIAQLFTACEQVSVGFPHTRISSLYLVDHDQGNLYRVLEDASDQPGATIGVGGGTTAGETPRSVGGGDNATMKVFRANMEEGIMGHVIRNGVVEHLDDITVHGE